MDKAIKALAQELLLETVQYYNSNNRGYVAKQGCVYAREDDMEKRCAIGRILTEDGLQKIIAQGMNGGNTIVAVIETLGAGIIQERWRPLFLNVEGLSVVRRIQLLHDTEENWSSSGITPRGVSHALGISRHIWEEKAIVPELA